MIGRLREKRFVADRGGFTSEKGREILVEQGKLGAGELRAVAEARESGGGSIRGALGLKGLVSEEAAARAAAVAGGFEYVELRENLADPAPFRFSAKKVLRRHAALPLPVEEDGLVLAMADPTDVLAFDDLEALAGFPIKPVVAAESGIRHAQDRVFGINEEVHEFLKGSNGRPLNVGEGDALSVMRGDGDAPVVRLVNSVIHRSLGEGARGCDQGSPPPKQLSRQSRKLRAGVCLGWPRPLPMGG